MEKKELRRQILQVRDGLAEEERQQLSQRVMDRLWQWEPFLQADRILSYASFRSETGTDLLNESILRAGKKLYLPKTYPAIHRMAFYRVEWLEELVCGYQGIREPQEGGQLFEEGGQTVMLMPGVAFDEERNRLGYGGGYYDRYLSQYGDGIAYTCMLAFECQRVDKIETEHRDVRPDRIVTEWR